MHQLENCQARYRSNTWMGRTRTDGPDEFEPSKFDCTLNILVHSQGSHRLEKYLNIQDCLEKSLKIKEYRRYATDTIKARMDQPKNYKIKMCVHHYFEMHTWYT